jgi:hypothetical protein
MQAPQLQHFGLRIWIVELEVFVWDRVLFRRQVRFIEETPLVLPGHVLVLTRIARLNWEVATPPPGHRGWEWLDPVGLVQLRNIQAPQYRPQARGGLDARHQYAESESDRTDIDGEAADN